MAVLQTCPHSRDATTASTGMSKLPLSSGTANGVPMLVWSSAAAAGWPQVAQEMLGWGARTELHAAAVTLLPVPPLVNLKLAQVCLHKLQLGCDCGIKIHPTGDHRQPELQRKHLSYICNQARAAGIVANLLYLWLILHTLQIHLCSQSKGRFCLSSSPAVNGVLD